jgi:iron complex outermembrane receptor protein
MNHIDSARPWARLLLLGCAAIPAQARARDTDQSQPNATIVVTGTRLDESANGAATHESVTAAELRTTTNIVNVEDSLRYLPSLLVRKRHIGDTQAPLATRTSGVGASARSLIYVDGVLLSALVGNNNTFASPRWGLVSPEEIERIDLLYGPYSAAYPGNSIGAVVNFTTRLPDGPTGSLVGETEVQHFSQYATAGDFAAGRLAATWGDRSGPLAWFVSASHVASHGQPLAYVTAARPAGMGATGVPVTGAFDDVNRTGAPVYVIGAGGIEDQDQENVALHLALDLGPSLRISWRGAVFLNDTEAGVQSYLRNAVGAPVYAGILNIEGRSVTVPASAFSNNLYSLDERHFINALTVEGSALGFDWRAIGSAYDFDRDVQRIPSAALPAAADGGAGSIVRLDGTGWQTFDINARRRGGAAASHDLSFGLHGDRFALASNRFATADWRTGDQGALVQASRGRTRTIALWAQDRWTLARGVDLTLGARYEWWRAYDGFNFSAAPALSVNQPEQRRRGFSPKLSLRWTGGNGWRVTLSAGQAYRFPTVSELYQAVSTGPSLTVPDPTLRPERARSEELAIERSSHNVHLRLSLFNEAIRDALISQSAPLVTGSTTLFSYVQNIPRVRTRGIELAGEWHGLLPGLDLSGSVTIVDPRTIDDPVFPAAEGKPLPQVPRRRATAVLTYHVGARTAFTLAGRYASRMFATIDNSDPVGHTFQGFERYFVLDARMTYRLNAHLELAAGVENLNNDRYYLFHPFPQRAFTAEVAWRW